MSTTHARARRAAALVSVLESFGDFFAFVGAVLRRIPKRPFNTPEAARQAWIIMRVIIIPTGLVAIPLGAVVALQIGSLTQQLGAQSFAGAASVVAIVREGAPLATALLLAGASGSAICADFGARVIREEVDALRVLGIDIEHRLIVPRVVAAVFVGGVVTGLVMGIGIAGGYFFNVVLQGGTSGVYVQSFSSLAAVADVTVSLVKGMVFGGIAAIVGAYKGLHTKGGPKGVGQAVNESVVLTFLFLFTLNYLITTIYFQVVPQGAR
jgi:phospholipid/cholesterol/gamma-HCH transport system permease protein